MLAFISQTALRQRSRAPQTWRPIVRQNTGVVHPTTKRKYTSGVSASPLFFCTSRAPPNAVPQMPDEEEEEEKEKKPGGWGSVWVWARAALPCRHAIAMHPPLLLLRSLPAPPPLQQLPPPR